uniref:Aldo-keto reductase family 1, member A1b (aldehyde reductase) n=1 Tax=Sphaeramia orbicularis TaxID=375764 RepID=A0A672YRV1_9TELE
MLSLVQPCLFLFQALLLRDMNYFAVLNTGRKMPLLGLGTWKSQPGQVMVIWTHWSVNGHLDPLVIQKVGLIRFVLVLHQILRRRRCVHHIQAVEQLDYLDLYLIHWPYAFRRGDVNFPRKEDGYHSVRRHPLQGDLGAMEKLVGKGLVRAIGLSNFNSQQIDDILSVATIKPAVLQVESHPYLSQEDLLGHCRDRGLVLTPDEPVVLDEPVIAALAQKYNKSPAQIILRWQTQRGVVTIPKSVTESLFDFTLEAEEMQTISALNKGWRYIVPMIEVSG